MPLTRSQKNDVRRHLKYPQLAVDIQGVGAGTLGADAGWRYNEEFGILEKRMNSLTPEAEASLTGAAYGAVQFVAIPPNNGDSLTLTISGGNLSAPVQKIVTASDTINTHLKLALQLALLIMTDSALVQAGFRALAPYGLGQTQSSNDLAIAEVGITSPKAFTLTVVTSGQVAASQTSDGEFQEPSIDMGTLPDGTEDIRYGFITILNLLDRGFASAQSNFDIAQAGDYKARSDEAKARKEHYYDWQCKLSNFLDVPLNTYAAGKRSVRRVL